MEERLETLHEQYEAQVSAHMIFVVTSLYTSIVTCMESSMTCLAWRGSSA